MAELEPNILFSHEAQEGREVLHLVRDTKEGHISPIFGDNAHAVIILRSFKVGLGVGWRIGHGFLLTKLPAHPRDITNHGDDPRHHHHHTISSGYNWSAPIFVQVKVLQAGLCFGYAQVRSFFFALTDKIIRQLSTSKGHVMLGIDHTFTLLGPSPETKSDVIFLSAGTSDLIGASVAQGGMMDFSFAGGSMTVDRHKMQRMYGTASVKAILEGTVQPPKEMGTLYSELNEMIVGSRTLAPTITRASLQKFTIGEDRTLDSGYNVGVVLPYTPPRLVE